MNGDVNMAEYCYSARLDVINPNFQILLSCSPEISRPTDSAAALDGS